MGCALAAAQSRAILESMYDSSATNERLAGDDTGKEKTVMRPGHTFCRKREKIAAKRPCLRQLRGVIIGRRKLHFGLLAKARTLSLRTRVRLLQAPLRALATRKISSLFFFERAGFERAGSCCRALRACTAGKIGKLFRRAATDAPEEVDCPTA
jgi:hypothetical protein